MKMNRDEEVDRNYVRGLQAGWNKGYDAGYIAGRLAYAVLSDKQKSYWESELESVFQDFALCIENRLKEIREQ